MVTETKGNSVLLLNSLTFFEVALFFMIDERKLVDFCHSKCFSIEGFSHFSVSNFF